MDIVGHIYKYVKKNKLFQELFFQTRQKNIF